MSFVKSLKNVVKRAPFGPRLQSFLADRRRRRAWQEWKARGSPIPPPHAIKQRVLRDCARRFGTRILVETGTFRGEMLEALKHDFVSLYSVELSERFHQEATARFRTDRHVHLLLGDSGRELSQIIETLAEPALFWLDGHYSEGETARGAKDTPIVEELEHIARSPVKGHVIIIDDARCFGTDPAYPTLEEIGEFAARRFPTHLINVQADGIQLLPRQRRSKNQLA